MLQVEGRGAKPADGNPAGSYKTNTPQDSNRSGPNDCINIYDAGAQGAVQLPDGTYHELEPDVAHVTEAALQRQLAAKGIPPLPEETIEELEACGLVKN